MDQDAPAYASQFQPMIAVNPDGVLGVYWYDTEGFPSRDRFDISFTASVDGGANVPAQEACFERDLESVRVRQPAARARSCGQTGAS